MRRRVGRGGLIFILEIMMLASVAFSYPSFQRAFLRTARRTSMPFWQPSQSSLRYLTSSNKDTKDNQWHLKSQQQQQQQSALETEHEGVEPKTKELKNQTETEPSLSQSSLFSSSTSSLDSLSDSFNTTAASWTKSLFRSVRRGAGAVASTAGFLSSSTASLYTDRAQWRRIRPTVEALQVFLNTSGIELELSPSLNYHLLRNVVILGRIQRILNAEKGGRREQARAKTSTAATIRQSIPSREEALRYMRYATAAYGSTMIAAAEMDARGIVDTRFSPLTRTRIAEHINVPEEDIVLVDVDHGGDAKHLRHFVAVDHVNRKVVLSIRGTFSISEIVVDVAGFSRPFYGGEAHSEMATMAERVWTVAGGVVRNLLKEHDDYEFIVTGHSLGAGCANLINIMCHNRGRRLIERRKMRCFAYASPPVFTPLELVPQAVQSATNYIHEEDVVPFLSVDSIRHVFASVRAIEDYMQQKMTRTERVRLSMGIVDPDEGLIEVVREAINKRLEPKKGAPMLAIPAAASLWMKEQEDGSFDYEICDPDSLSKLGPNMNLRIVEDHLPPRYEHAFENLVQDPASSEN